MAPRRGEAGSALVVGAGVFGMAAALELRRRGWSVTVVDPGPLPHPRASSTDVSKVVRTEYGDDDFLTELAGTALAGWKARNRAGGRPLFHRDGFLVLARDAMAPGGFEHESFVRLRERGVAVERLDPLTLASRFPAWNADRFRDGYFNPEAGWAESGEVVREMVGRARRAGVETVAERASGLRIAGSAVKGVELAGGDAAAADVIVVAAGAWTPSIVPGADRILRAVGQPLLWLGVDEPARWSPPHFPVWAADIARTGWYGFPADARSRLKIGHHGPGVPASPDDPPEVARSHVELCRDFLAGALPDLADSPVVESRTCFYCDSADGLFLVDRHPELDRLVVASGGSGHGFKFAPVLGPLIADVVEGRENVWGRPFRWRDAAPSSEAARLAGGAAVSSPGDDEATRPSRP